MKYACILPFDSFTGHNKITKQKKIERTTEDEEQKKNLMDILYAYHHTHRAIELSYS